MKNVIYIISLKFIAIGILGAQNFPYKISRVDDNTNYFDNNPCDVKVKVMDERPVDCIFGGDYYFYPVFTENFNYKEDLPNNWAFNLGYTNDDDYAGGTTGATWLGDPYGNDNVYTDNGICVLKWKKEHTSAAQANSNVPAKDYEFTGAFLNSCLKMRQGVFEARIRLPSNANFFPAYWLTDHQEIDIFEFFDGDLSSQHTCDTYHMMKMNIHGYLNSNGNVNQAREGTHCNRNRKFPVSEDFFNSYHIYKCVWTDYRIQIYLDNTLVAYSTKFYDGPFIPSDGCDENADSGVPSWTRDCNYMSSAQGCNAYYPWPINDQCADYNKVYKDITFPMTSIPMNLIISNKLLHGQSLYNSWNTYLPVDKQVEIDWVKIYQPINCGNSFSFNTEADLKWTSHNTNFMTGYNLCVSNGQANNTYINEAPTQANNWHNFPTHLLASNEIYILNEAIFEEGTYLRAEIIDCSGGFNEYQRLNNQSGQFLSDEEIRNIEKQKNDSLGIIDDKVIKISNENILKSKYDANELSLLDNGAISIYPNPTVDLLNIAMDDEDYNDLIEIKIINVLGQEFNIKKSKVINASLFNDGFYKIRFVFSSGRFVFKKFIKSSK